MATARVPNKPTATPTNTGVKKMAVQFEVVGSGYPNKGTGDPEIVALGTQAMKDRAVRRGPSGDDTNKLLTALRQFADSQGQKLKTRTVGNYKYWSIEPRPDSENGK